MKTRRILKVLLVLAVFTSSASHLFAGADANPGVWIARDDMAETQGGPNLYGFVLNDPINRVDPFGLWPTEIHNQIIESAGKDIRPRLGFDDYVELKNASGIVDEARGQLSDAAFIHAMRSKDETVASARGKWNAYIRNNLTAAQDEQDKWYHSGKCGYSPEALKRAGFALHAVTDSTSPSHKGFQVWDPTIGNVSGQFLIPSNFKFGAVADHIVKESTILPGELSATVSLFKANFKIAFSKRNVRAPHGDD